MRLKNYTKLPEATVREVLAFVCPPGVIGDVNVKNLGSGRYRGMAYHEGHGSHGNSRPLVVVSIGAPSRFPWLGDRNKKHEPPQFRSTQYYEGGKVVRTVTRKVTRGGYLPAPPIASQTEALVYVLAHELRHLWQARVPRGRRVWGSRGQFSERDADAFALQMLRQWRRRVQS